MQHARLQGGYNFSRLPNPIIASAHSYQCQTYVPTPLIQHQSRRQLLKGMGYNTAALASVGKAK